MCAHQVGEDRGGAVRPFMDENDVACMCGASISPDWLQEAQSHTVLMTVLKPLKALWLSCRELWQL